MKKNEMDFKFALNRADKFYIRRLNQILSWLSHGSLKG
jgi:hypothetical protein